MWSGVAFAGMSLPGLPGVGKKLAGDSSSASGTASGGAGNANSRSFKQSVTITHPTKNFRYTIPAGWAISAGDVGDKASDDVNNVPVHNPSFQNITVEGKTVGPCGFTMTIEPMVKSFPRDSSVAAGLKQDKERIAIKQVVDAKRRDQGDPKKKCSFIGWQTEEAQRPDPTYGRGINYRGYDQDNVSYTFRAACADKDFQACRKDFLQIINSIQFCVK
jgi:hypothetical protein